MQPRRSTGRPRDIVDPVSVHPRSLGGSWVRQPLVAARTAREPRAEREAPEEEPRYVALHVPRTDFVPTAEEHIRMGVLPSVHRLTRQDMAAWNAADESEREEARRAIREGVRAMGGGELVDHRGRRIERVE